MIFPSEYPANCNRTVPAKMPVALDISVRCHQPKVRAGASAEILQIHQSGDAGWYGGDEADPDRDHRSGGHHGRLESGRTSHEHRDAGSV